jgi:hypothetical protein
MIDIDGFNLRENPQVLNKATITDETEEESIYNYVMLWSNDDVDKNKLLTHYLQVSQKS